MKDNYIKQNEINYLFVTIIYFDLHESKTDNVTTISI